jgi:DivIVA domain-containing protein
MEVTPKVFRDVQFREKARGGYHPEDVDEFLEQAALGAEVLLERLRDATERAERAEKTATDASATDDALKRMLLMGQRTVDEAVKEAREEADQLLAAARAQAGALVADAEERGRRAYEDSLADSRSKMEEADRALRQAEQEVEALRGWVDVNRSHLLAVMRDAQGLIENAGLLSEAPRPNEPPQPRELAVPGEAAAPAAVPLRPEPQVADGVGIPSGEDNAPTGEWDARLLDEVSRADASAAAEPSPEGEGGEAASNGVPALTGSSAEGGGEGPHTSPGDQTMAFDERALDSFFNEQDMGDERGLGRFRRRQ